MKQSLSLSMMKEVKQEAGKKETSEVKSNILAALDCSLPKVETNNDETKKKYYKKEMKDKRKVNWR